MPSKIKIKENPMSLSAENPMATTMADAAHAALPVKAVELLASRICHDLVSPVGAVNNGVEFVRDMGDDAIADSMQLIEHSARQASVRLQLFRLCYGAGGSEKLVTGKMIYESFDNFIDKSKYSFSWDLLNHVPDDMPMGAFKMISNALVFVHDALPKGGTIEVVMDDDKMVMRGKGDMVRLRSESEDALSGNIKVDQLDPKNIHAFVTYHFGHFFGLPLTLSYDESDISISFSLS
jgi:histidine phosphotransferase ChpT